MFISKTLFEQMKEAVSTREVNQFLVGERTKLQNEKSHLEKELEIERKNNDERKVEIQDVIRKVSQITPVIPLITNYQYNIITPK
jgi:hypothetical protein